MQAKTVLSYIEKSMFSNHYKLFLIHIDSKCCAEDFTFRFKIFQIWSIFRISLSMFQLPQQTLLYKTVLHTLGRQRTAGF